MSTKKSLAFEDKLNNRFAPSPIMADFDLLLNTAQDKNNFQSRDDLENYLSEGAMLQINKLGAHALSIPNGEYIVWTTDAGNTMLVPTASQRPAQEVFEASTEQYELFTKDLLDNYNSCGKAILEYSEGGMDSGAEMPEDSESNSGEFDSNIQMNSVDRTPIARAMKQKGYTVSSLASACGVEPPAISRILRTPKDTVGDPGGRNPSMGLAAQISSTLKMDPESLFPDIFNVQKQKLGARDQPGNRGSGMDNSASGSARMGKATEKWTQGGPQNEEAIRKFSKTARKLLK